MFSDRNTVMLFLLFIQVRRPEKSTSHLWANKDDARKIHQTLAQKICWPNNTWEACLGRPIKQTNGERELLLPASSSGSIISSTLFFLMLTTEMHVSLFHV
jgi:hypothetical protein